MADTPSTEELQAQLNKAKAAFVQSTSAIDAALVVIPQQEAAIVARDVLLKTATDQAREVAKQVEALKAQIEELKNNPPTPVPAPGGYAFPVAPPAPPVITKGERVVNSLAEFDKANVGGVRIVCVPGGDWTRPTGAVLKPRSDTEIVLNPGVLLAVKGTRQRFVDFNDGTQRVRITGLRVQGIPTSAGVEAAEHRLFFVSEKVSDVRCEDWRVEGGGVLRVIECLYAKTARCAFTQGYGQSTSYGLYFGQGTYKKPGDVHEDWLLEDVHLSMMPDAGDGKGDGSHLVRTHAYLRLRLNRCLLTGSLLVPNATPDDPGDDVSTVQQRSALSFRHGSHAEFCNGRSVGAVNVGELEGANHDERAPHSYITNSDLVLSWDGFNATPGAEVTIRGGRIWAHRPRGNRFFRTKTPAETVGDRGYAQVTILAGAELIGDKDTRFIAGGDDQPQNKFFKLGHTVRRTGGWHLPPDVEVVPE